MNEMPIRAKTILRSTTVRLVACQTLVKTYPMHSTQTRLQHSRQSGQSYQAPPIPILPQRRVVVTGLGLVSPLGCNVDLFWTRLVQGKCGVRSQVFEDFQQFKGEVIPSKVAARVENTDNIQEADDKFCIDKYAPRDKKNMARFTQFAVAACTEALLDSKIELNSPEIMNRTGISVGSGVGSMEDIYDNHELLRQGQYRRISPYFIPRLLTNMASGNASILHKLKGPNHCVVTACATGAHSIGDAYKMVKFGDADAMLCGGTEACLNPVAFAGFSRAKALSTGFNDTPHLASRPFDKQRDGFVMGEGAGVIVLEEYEHAKRRNAKIYAEIRGYGLTGEGYHITAPSPDGSGAVRAMSMALAQSGFRPEDVNYINAHATSTPLGDAVENMAIKTVFGDHSKNLKISSIKGAIGHLLGAAGGVEAIATILAIKNNTIPPTLNLYNADEGLDLDYVPHTAQQSQVDVAITNSFGFGGTNASLLFSRV